MCKVREKKTTIANNRLKVSSSGNEWRLNFSHIASVNILVPLCTMVYCVFGRFPTFSQPSIVGFLFSLCQMASLDESFQKNTFKNRLRDEEIRFKGCPHVFRGNEKHGFQYIDLSMFSAGEPCELRRKKERKKRLLAAYEHGKAIHIGRAFFCNSIPAGMILKTTYPANIQGRLFEPDDCGTFKFAAPRL